MKVVYTDHKEPSFLKHLRWICELTKDNGEVIEGPNLLYTGYGATKSEAKADLQRAIAGTLQSVLSIGVIVADATIIRT